MISKYIWLTTLLCIFGCTSDNEQENKSAEANETVPNREICGELSVPVTSFSNLCTEGDETCGSGLKLYGATVTPEELDRFTLELKDTEMASCFRDSRYTLRDKKFEICEANNCADHIGGGCDHLFMSAPLLGSEISQILEACKTSLGR